MLYLTNVHFFRIHRFVEEKVWSSRLVKTYDVLIGSLPKLKYFDEMFFREFVFCFMNIQFLTPQQSTNFILNSETNF